MTKYILDKQLWRDAWFTSLPISARLAYIYLAGQAESANIKTAVGWLDFCEAMNASPVEAVGLVKSLHFEYVIHSDRPSLENDCFSFLIPQERFRRLADETEYKRGAISQETKLYIHALDNYTCVYCGAPSEEIDHVYPVSRGGSDDIENLVSACQTCNRKKSDKTMSELGWSFMVGSRPLMMAARLAGI